MKNNARNFSTWLSSMHDDPANIQAYFFGLFETNNGYTIYLTGSNTYNEADDDWACSNDFYPKNKFFDLGLKDRKWEEVLNSTINLIKDFMKSEDYKNHFI